MQLSYRYMSKYVFLIVVFLNSSLFCGLDYGLHKNLENTEGNDPKSWAVQNGGKKDSGKANNDQKNSSNGNGNRSPRERGKNPFFESLA